MRSARLKIDEQPTWYHCYNRIAGTSRDIPFGDAEKEQFVRFLRRVSRLYTVRVIAYQVMSNHFHLLVHAPTEMPDPEEVCRRYEAFHRGKRTLDSDSPACRLWQERCRDISWFMRHLQQLFTMWYNRTRPLPRRGSLWADRFKHTLLESGTAVWSCWTYIENNAVRAGLVNQAADYRFCSHGFWRQSGRHPFSGNVAETALPMLRDLFGVNSVSAIGAAMDEALAGKKEEQADMHVATLSIQRRVRYWTQGLVIGSKLYLRYAMSRYRTPSEFNTHRVAVLKDHNSTLFAWRRIRCAAAD